MNLFVDTDEYTHEQIIALTRGWVERVVIGLNLCPFAKPVHVKNQISYALSHARDADAATEQLVRHLGKWNHLLYTSKVLQTTFVS